MSSERNWNRNTKNASEDILIYVSIYQHFHHHHHQHFWSLKSKNCLFLVEKNILIRIVLGLCVWLNDILLWRTNLPNFRRCVTFIRCLAAEGRTYGMTSLGVNCLAGVRQRVTRSVVQRLDFYLLHFQFNQSFSDFCHMTLATNYKHHSARGAWLVGTAGLRLVVCGVWGVWERRAVAWLMEQTTTS